ncbi:MAG: energy-coupling factor ABC transporter ATP-binding protein [Lachnospiraceae bacterium]|nr:energy-coupling factor ABC transporter ATP-binding protein [Lachnospiraceae bacterium]
MKTGIEKHLLHIENLSYHYENDEPVLRNINIDVNHGESIGVIGTNGVGKSTLLKLLVGLLLDYDGTLEVVNHPMVRENVNHIREHIGYVFQDSDNQLFMTTVQEDVAFGPINYGLPQEEVNRRVDEALRLTHIEHLRDKQVYKLSGGEKKLASIATILSMEPDIILMDEPSVALDPQNRRHLINLLNDLAPMKIIASHDLDFVLDTCDRVVLLYEGEIIADGPAEEILTNKELLESHGLELPIRYYYQ